jgi:protocatechuate 3,4-dioxygenase beta subunit
MLKNLLFIFITLVAFKASGQQYMLSGRITDGQGHAIPFTSVYIRNSSYGTTANENGNYQFKVDPGTYHLIYRFVGYYR